VRIVTLPAVVGLLATLAFMAPRSFLLFKLLKEQYGAWCLLSFAMMLFMLLARCSGATVMSGDDPEGATFDSSPTQKIVDALAAQGPQKHFARPPICCLAYPCYPQHNLTVPQLLFVFWGIRQQVIVLPVLAIIDLWALLSLTEDVAESFHKVLEQMIKMSASLTLWCLFVILFACKEVLKDWSPTPKLVPVKIVLFLAILEEPIVGLIFEIPGLLDAFGGKCMDKEMQIDYGILILNCVVTMLVSIKMQAAFPAEELQAGEDVPLQHQAVMEMQLRKSLAQPQQQPPESLTMES
jgi:hypothetical protein